MDLSHAMMLLNRSLTENTLYIHAAKIRKPPHPFVTLRIDSDQPEV